MSSVPNTPHMNELVYLKPKPYRCEQCGKTFGWKTSLAKHLRNHFGTRLYQCSLCEKSLSSRQSLVWHIQTHTGEKPHKCDQCDKSFARRATLDEHGKTHTGEKPYQCERCDRAFARKANLDDHRRTHADGKPYRCIVCGRRFAQKSHLAVHIKTHSVDEPCQQEGCEMRLVQKDGLKYDARIQTNVGLFQCLQCREGFPTQQTLVQHTEVHNQSQQYGNMFILTGSTGAHVKTQTGEIPYLCLKCDKNFGSEFDLDCHVRMHNSDELESRLIFPVHLQKGVKLCRCARDEKCECVGDHPQQRGFQNRSMICHDRTMICPLGTLCIIEQINSSQDDGFEVFRPVFLL